MVTEMLVDSAQVSGGWPRPSATLTVTSWFQALSGRNGDVLRLHLLFSALGVSRPCGCTKPRVLTSVLGYMELFLFLTTGVHLCSVLGAGSRMLL